MASGPRLYGIAVAQRHPERFARSAMVLPDDGPRHAVDKAMLPALKEGHREFLRFAIKRTGSLEGGEELVRQFYQQAIGALAGGGETLKLKRWLIESMRHALAAYRTSGGQCAEREYPDLDGRLPMLLDDVERTVSGCLYRILPALPGDTSWLLWQADLLGLPPERIAARLGISSDRLALRLTRARQFVHTVLRRFTVTCPTHGFLNCTCEK